MHAPERRQPQRNLGDTTLAWPVGTERDLNSDVAESDAPMFVRDTTESLLETEGTSDFDAELSEDSETDGL
jgi:hypothetical protein